MLYTDDDKELITSHQSDINKIRSNKTYAKRLKIMQESDPGTGHLVPALAIFAFDALNDGKNHVKVGELAEYMESSDKTVRRYIRKRPDEYWIENGLVGRHE